LNQLSLVCAAAALLTSHDQFQFSTVLPPLVDFFTLPFLWDNNIDYSIAAEKILLITQNSKSRPYPASETMMAALWKGIFMDIFVRLSTLAFNVCNVYAD
jgi:hypothetical protein